jgi:hypothetical protein
LSEEESMRAQATLIDYMGIRYRIGHATYVAGVVACVAVSIALGGCGGTSKHMISARLSVGEASHFPGFIACMRRNGMTVFSNGDLQMPRTVTPAQLDAAERMCGFGVAKVSGSSKNAAEARSEKEFQKRVEHTRAFHQLIAKLVDCLRQHGVNVPESDLNSLPDAEGIDMRSRKIKTTIRKCRSELLENPPDKDRG